MSVDLDYMAELFEPVGRVQFRRMFGGHGIYRDGLMFGLIARDVVHLKVDDSNRAAYEAAGCEPFRVERKGGKVIALSYWSVPERLLDEPDELTAWAMAAVEVAIRHAATKSGGRRR